MTELVVGPAMLRDTVAWLAENAKGLSMADWDLHSHHILAAANQLERALAAPPSPQSPVATQASKERVFRLPAAQELLEARQEIELLRAEVEKYKAWAASCEPAPDSVRAAFKNFHRLLCERFNYLHDEKDWERDQLSLIEWIAERELKAMRTAAETITPQSPVEPVASNERLTLPWRIEWRNSPIADTGDYDCVLSIQASNGETVVDSWNPGHYVEEAFQKIVHAVNAHEWDKRTVETPMPQSPIAAKAPQSVTLNGFQARMLMKFADAEDDCYMEIATLPARKSTDGEDMEAGLYVWMTEYPQEGCLLLTEKPTEQGFCSESPAKAPAAEMRELSASEAASFGKAFASSPRRLSAEVTTITGRDRIEQNVREIQQICDACNFDPTEWLNDETAIGEDPAKRCQHDLLKPGCTVRIDSDHRGGQCMVCLESWRLSADGLSVITELCAEQEETGEPSPCGHLRSEFLAEKQVAGESLFQMRKCLDCKKIFRVRSSLPAHHDGPDDETDHAGRDAE